VANERKIGLSDKYVARMVVVTVLVFAALSNFAFAESAADIFKAKCSACHGKNGSGDTMIGRNLKIRSLASDEVQKQSDDELFTIIHKGRNRMPAFDRKLTPQEIREVVKYVRALKK
jgi:mono/diheme cytochrome c family protein